MRNFVLNEPRGGVFRHVNLLVLPNRPEADAAFIIMEPEDMPPMSGSNAICVSTVLLDAGILPLNEPVTEFTLEAPRRLVRVRADGPSGRRAVCLQVDRVDHHRLRNGCFGGQAIHHTDEDIFVAPPLPTVVKGLRRPIIRRSASPQTIAVDEDFAAQHPLVIDARLAHPQENSPADCFLFFGYS